MVIVSRELQLTGDSIEHVQVTTIHEHKIHESDQAAVEVHSDIKVLDTEASKSVIEEFVEKVQAAVEDQKVEALDQSFVEIERHSFSEIQEDKVEEPTQTLATEESLTLSFESAYVVREQEQEPEVEQQQESSASSESEQEKEEEKVEVVVEQTTIELSHTGEEETVAEISISTSSATTTTEAMEEHTAIRAYTQLEEHPVEEAEETEDALELDEQKAAEVDAMVNDEDIVHVSHNDSYIQEDRVETTFYSSQPLDSLLSPKKNSSEEFPGQREAAERIDKALAIAEAASPYSSVKNLMASTSDVTSTTTTTTEEYSVNGQANGVQKRKRSFEPSQFFLVAGPLCGHPTHMHSLLHTLL